MLRRSNTNVAPASLLSPGGSTSTSTPTRDRRFRELSKEQVERLREASEAAAAARAQAKEEADKAAKKASKQGGGKAKKPAKGAAAPPPPTPEEEAAALEEAVEPPSVLDVYEEVKREVERHRRFRKEEEERHRAEERLVPRDPTGEAVLEEVGFHLASHHVVCACGPCCFDVDGGFLRSL